MHSDVRSLSPSPGGPSLTLALDPRPTPTQVHAYLAQDLSDAALRTLHAVLAADPNWDFRQTRGPASWLLDLSYAPAGLHLHVVLRRHLAPDGARVWQRLPES